jgi:hypothetical protein
MNITTTSFATPMTTPTTMIRALALLCVLAPLSGCFDPSYSTDTPFWCTAETPSCPDGYVCDTGRGLCTKPGSSSANTCVDRDLEPNDSADKATNLDSALAGHPQGTSLYGVQICTSEDKDYYSFTVSARKRATVQIQYKRDQGELGATLLDPSQTPITQGVVVGGGLELDATLEPQSFPYFVLVEAGPGGTTNLYDFSISFVNMQ